MLPRTEVDVPRRRACRSARRSAWCIAAAALALPGAARLGGRHHRLRPHPRPASIPTWRPAQRARRRSRPRDHPLPGSKDGAARAVRDAPRAPAPGDRAGRVRRHRRHRHDGGSGRGADRRHPATSTTSSTCRRSRGDSRRHRRWTACSTSTTSRSRPGIELAEGPYETVAGFVMAELGRVPLLGDVVESTAITGSRWSSSTVGASRESR